MPEQYALICADCQYSYQGPRPEVLPSLGAECNEEGDIAETPRGPCPKCEKNSKELNFIYALCRF